MFDGASEEHGEMPVLNWCIDTETQRAAHNFPIRIYMHEPEAPWAGRFCDLESRRHRIRQIDDFPPQPWFCSPDQIIAEFRATHYLSALVLTVFWGKMWRTADRYIYRQHQLQEIHTALQQCAESIQHTQSIQEAWDLLRRELGWTSVINSKVLHFLCRALGFEQNPPVPIDGRVIRGYVWPGFRIGIPPEHRSRVLDWEGDEISCYCRYMTAIIEWAEARGWTTTQVEATLFAENQ
jgi:hypothetical protein